MSEEKVANPDLYKNYAFSEFEPNPKQSYQAWRANPEKWAGWWDTYEGKLRPYDVPDYRIYKIDGIWQLEHVKRTLAKRGLTDPWIRNEVWRYPPDANHSRGVRIMVDSVVGKNYFGVKWALVATVVTIIGDNLWYKYKYGGRPEFAYDFRDWVREYVNMKPNQ